MIFSPWSCEIKSGSGLAARLSGKRLHSSKIDEWSNFLFDTFWSKFLVSYISTKTSLASFYPQKVLEPGSLKLKSRLLVTGWVGSVHCE